MVQPRWLELELHRLPWDVAWAPLWDKDECMALDTKGHKRVAYPDARSEPLAHCRGRM